MADPQAYGGHSDLSNADNLIRQLRNSLSMAQRSLGNMPQDAQDARSEGSPWPVAATQRRIQHLQGQLADAEENKRRVLLRFPNTLNTADLTHNEFSQHYGHHAPQPIMYAEDEPKQENIKHIDAMHGSGNHGSINHGGINHGGINHGSINHGSINHGSSNHGSINYKSDHHHLNLNGSYGHSPYRAGLPSFIPNNMASPNPEPVREWNGYQARSKRTLSNARESIDPMSPGRSKRSAFGDHQTLIESRRNSTSSDSSIMDLTETDDQIEAAVAQKRLKTESRRLNIQTPVANVSSILPPLVQDQLARQRLPQPTPPAPAPLYRTDPMWPPLNDRPADFPRRKGPQSRRAPPTGLAATIERASRIDFTTMTDFDGNPLDDYRQRDLQRILGDSPPRMVPRQQVDRAEVERQRQHIEEFVRTMGAEIPDNELDAPPPGLRYPLYAHQKQALTWMKKQEAGKSKGGILGDDMGLGKTISTLALMIANPGQDTCRTTLIIAPLSLVRQWEEEIKDKLMPEHQLSICVFHESNRPQATKLMQYDVVLTTYQTLCSEHKKVKTFWEQAADRNVDQHNDPLLAQSVRLFHPTKSMFHRIVLDEAQMIKNRTGKTSLAATALMAKHRWCLTGTPMMNTLHEIFPFYRFLHIAPYNDWATFSSTFGSLKKVANPGTALNAFRVLLRKNMLRRDKKSEINGQRILQLPEKTEEIIHIDLEGEQLEYYKAVTENAQMVFNAYIRKGTSHKQYSVLLVQLLRMRQAVCHPHLVLDDEDGQSEVNDPKAASELAKTLKPQVVTRLVQQVRGAIESLEGFDCPICLDKIPNPAISFPCGHHMCSDCLRAHIENGERDNIRRGENAPQTRCAVCRDPLETNKVISLSIFKKVHMPEIEETEEENGKQRADESDSSGEDDLGDVTSDDDQGADDVNAQGNLRGFVVDDDELSDNNASSRLANAEQQVRSKPASKENKKHGTTGPKRKVKATMLKSLRKSAKISAQDNRDYRRYLSKHWMTSAKVQACIDLIKNIWDETGGRAKTLIFSQWTMFLDLMEIALQKDDDLKHVGHVRYDGEMNMKDRFASAQKFRESPKTKLMLISLKAGNAGLNLVQASRVIILDPFWNPFIEMQAVDRVHRIGQQHEVKVYRILVKDSVEDRIMEIQDNKRDAIGSALDGKASGGMGLSMADLRHLFGF